MYTPVPGRQDTVVTEQRRRLGMEILVEKEATIATEFQIVQPRTDLSLIICDTTIGFNVTESKHVATEIA